MKVEVKIHEELKEPYAIIYANEITEEIQHMVDMLANNENKILTGITDDKIFLLDKDEIYCFYSENQKIYAKTDKGNLWVKQKLYKLEEMFQGTSFIRISNSCIVNVDKIKNLEINFAGTIGIVFKNGEKEFVSRRYLSKIKKYLGI